MVDAPKRKHLCIYHSVDPDGWCSAALVYNYLTALGQECALYYWNYGMPVPYGRIEAADVVWLVDLRLPEDAMHYILRMKGEDDFCWIDHHPTSQDLVDQGFHTDGLVRVGEDEDKRGACALVWEYLYGGLVPEVIDKLARYDAWVWEEGDGCEEFEFGVRQHPDARRPSSDFWRALLDAWHPDHASTLQLVLSSAPLLQYKNEDWWAYARSYSFLTTIGGHQVVACNRMMANSRLFDAPGLGDKFPTTKCGVCFAYKSGQWEVRFYKARWHVNDIDFGAVAKSLHPNGGGHAGAAGCQLAELPAGFLPVAFEARENDRVQEG